MSAILIPAVTGGGSATVIMSGVGAVLAKIFKGVAVQAVLDGTKDIRNDVSDLKVRLASETGGNSNGLRQKVNELDGKVDAVAEDVAFLKGKASA